MRHPINEKGRMDRQDRQPVNITPPATAFADTEA